MIVRYLELDDYLAVAVAVTGLPVETVVHVANLDLADSAARLGGQLRRPRVYPDFVDKAAVLVVRLAKNHPLPDGNKRAAWVSLRVFVEFNTWRWDPYPDVAEAEAAVLAIAAGDWDEASTAGWLRSRLHPPHE